MIQVIDSSARLYQGARDTIRYIILTLGVVVFGANIQRTQDDLYDTVCGGTHEGSFEW